jgi:hypothetical protein
MKFKLEYLFFLIISIIAITGCERDDICIDEITPNLIIRFYDFEDQTETKSISQLSIKINGIENDSLFFSGTDSIFVPLKVTSNNTQFVFTVNSNDVALLNRDALTVNYSAEAVFVGRSCGYKSIFNNTTYDLTDDGNMWIQKIEMITEQIENETTAHVKIFY